MRVIVSHHPQHLANARPDGVISGVRIRILGSHLRLLEQRPNQLLALDWRTSWRAPVLVNDTPYSFEIAADGLATSAL
jgi:hypothetical protein